MVLVLQTVVEGLVGDRVPLRPPLALVQPVAVEALKGHEPDSRIRQNVVDFHGPDHDGLLPHGDKRVQADQGQGDTAYGTHRKTSFHGIV